MFHTMEAQYAMYDKEEKKRIHEEVVEEAVLLTLYNVAQVLRARRDAANGGEGLVHNVYFDN